MRNNVPAIRKVSEKELALSNSSDRIFNAEQLKYLLKKTPQKYIKTRPAKGGGTWTYVPGMYVKKVLNVLFGFNWSFEVVEYKFDLDIKQAFVLGKLTVSSRGQTIVRQQFGRVDIKFKKAVDTDAGRRLPLDLGNDLKAATTDALKKCAAELGIAMDVYAPEEFTEVEVIKDSPESELDELLELTTHVDYEVKVSEDDKINIKRIIDKEEDKSYLKVIKLLTKILN